LKRALIKLGYGAYVNGRLEYQHEFTFYFETLSEFKTGFLKRFGNIQMSSKAEKERQNIKLITYKASSTIEWENLINEQKYTRVYVKIS